MHLIWHRYKYYQYERELGHRELQSLLSPSTTKPTDSGVWIEGATDFALAQRLVYFSGTAEGQAVSEQNPTQQGLLERVNGNGTNRQSTRYSAHGLHEYKGKFNPQVAKAILNIFGARRGHLVLDPFCGSGTSLIECAHLGIKSIGTDINPLAVFLANAKLNALAIPSQKILSDAVKSLKSAQRSKCKADFKSERGEYLQSWFPEKQLTEIERLRSAIESTCPETKSVLLAIASNLLRDYSLQEPADLRIRRRSSPFPEKSFFNAFHDAVDLFCARLLNAQQIIGIKRVLSRAVLLDCRKAVGYSKLKQGSFDFALTSPPYATALPYIDTQRLSLVWLGLIKPSEISPLEAALVGSREIRGGRKKALATLLEKNEAELPPRELEFCFRLKNALTVKDGFRRQVMPYLLYRYFAGMAQAFEAVRYLAKPNAPFGLIIGGNHTVLGGTRFDIDTPEHLASIAVSRGWTREEMIPLQTYQRYGLHANNATTTEALLILRANSK